MMRGQRVVLERGTPAGSAGVALWPRYSILPVLPTLASPKLWTITLLAVVFACSSKERPPGRSHEAGSGAGVLRDAGSEPEGPPLPDAPGLCGNQIIEQNVDRPSLYFVLDRSGSMSERFEEGSFEKYATSVLAIRSVLRAIGHRVSYGAAVFPAFDSADDECATGEEVFAARPGDPLQYALDGEDGPVLKEFIQVLGTRPPGGGTPTSATLAALTPTLIEIEGKTALVLATDGEPNCNPDAICSGADCPWNVAHETTDDGRECGEDVNCCDPDIMEEGPLSCLDQPATLAALRELESAGIRSFVIGLPGSERFAEALDAMAEAGGTARSGGHAYFPVTSATELKDTLLGIGVSVAISCSIELSSPPPDPDLVNVYFDGRVVGSNAHDGWVLDGEALLDIRGSACEELKSGDVFQVQVVAGCPTVVI
ncbi:MAG: VWA domain-containing protein [Polyangiaceae bacterium]|nr:VWA domain-containing protein [Polyangiaceae bacterium]